MPISLWADRGDVPPLGDPAFDALLARALRPEEAVASLRPVVESFAALYAAPVHSGPAAESSVLAAFRGLAAPYGNRTGVHRAGVHRPGHLLRFRLVSAKLAVAAAAVAVTAGSAAAAYAGVLPAPMQRLADAVIGAPLGSRGTPQRVPGVPGLSLTPGSSAYGLCHAYERALAQGHPEHDPATLRRLAAAAGGAARVTAYCAQVAHPGNPSAGHPAHPQHGKPSALPTRHGKPSPGATHHGNPSALPTPAGTHHGKPTG